MLTLGAINFSDPAMLVGLLAGLIPIVLHLRQRIRAPIVPFPTLRFLKLTAMKTARRRQIQEYFLLFLRIVLFALLASALARPFIGGGNLSLAYSMVLMLLAGCALLLLATIYASQFFTKDQPAPLTTATPDAPTPARTPNPVSRKKSGIFSFLFLLVGLGLLLFAFTGLASDQFFDSHNGRYSGRSTACVIILDNSHSMLARQDSQSRFQSALTQVHGILTDPLTPAEVAILPTNLPSSGWNEHLTTDTTGVLGTLDTLSISGSARPLPGLVSQALQLLQTSTQENKMLIIVADFAGNSASSPDLFSSLQNAKIEFKNFQLVLMPQSLAGAPNDVGIIRCNIVGGSIVPGGEVLLEAELVNNGDTATVRDLELLRDHHPLPGQTWRCQMGPAGQGTGRASLKFPYHITNAGMQHLTLQLKDSADALAWDDQRDLLIQVPEPPPVLVIGPTPGFPPARSAAHYVWTALAPYTPPPSTKGQETPKAATTAGQNILWGGVDTLTTESLNRFAAIFICDVPDISPTTAERLARFVASGHRLIWILGPNVKPDLYNTHLPPGLLPHRLSAPIHTPKGSIVDWVNDQSPLWRELFDTQEPFHAMVVTDRWALPDNRPQQGEIIAKLADGSPLLIQQVLGASNSQTTTRSSHGEIYTLLTSPTPAWSTLATTVPFVPMIQRMALGDPASQNGPGSYEPNQSVKLPLGQLPKGTSVDIQVPSGSTYNLIASNSTTELLWEFTHTAETGLYQWHTTNHRDSGSFFINPPGEEAILSPINPELLTQSAQSIIPSLRPTIVAATSEILQTKLSERAAGQPLLPGLLALILTLLLAEALMANLNPPHHKS